MSEFINSEKTSNMDKLQSETVTMLDQILKSEDNFNWTEVFKTSNDEIGEILNTRLIISELWKSQADAMNDLRNSIDAENAEYIIVDYIKQFDNKISDLASKNETFLETLKNNTLTSLSDDEIREYIQAIIKYSETEINISNELSNLSEWVSVVRMEIVETLWSSVKEQGEIQNNNTSNIIKAINQAQDKFIKISKGSLFQNDR